MNKEIKHIKCKTGTKPKFLQSVVILSTYLVFSKLVIVDLL